jgi:hypothetical protein
MAFLAIFTGLRRPSGIAINPASCGAPARADARGMPGRQTTNIKTNQAGGGADRPSQGAENAQDEDQVERQEALSTDRQRQGTPAAGR